jgi:hypothetical protein
VKQERLAREQLSHRRHFSAVSHAEGSQYLVHSLSSCGRISSIGILCVNLFEVSSYGFRARQNFLFLLGYTLGYRLNKSVHISGASKYDIAHKSSLLISLCRSIENPGNQIIEEVGRGARNDHLDTLWLVSYRRYISYSMDRFALYSPLCRKSITYLVYLPFFRRTV